MPPYLWVIQFQSRAIIHLGYLSQGNSSNLPGNRADHTLEASLTAPLFGLAPDGVYPATSVAGSAVRSYRTISPLPRSLKPQGGIFSVALSVGSRPPGVTWRPVHWSPDFPPSRTRQDSDFFSFHAPFWPSFGVCQERLQKRIGLTGAFKEDRHYGLAVVFGWRR